MIRKTSIKLEAQKFSNMIIHRQQEGDDDPVYEIHIDRKDVETSYEIFHGSPAEMVEFLARLKANCQDFMIDNKDLGK